MKHLKRGFNEAAHELAQIAKSVGDSQIWEGIEAPMLHRLLIIDKENC